jgi:hypothetical protein
MTRLEFADLDLRQVSSGVSQFLKAHRCVTLWSGNGADDGGHEIGEPRQALRNGPVTSNVTPTPPPRRPRCELK